MFFCQLEAVETVIWLVEAPESEKQGIIIPGDAPNDPESIAKHYEELRRLGCKMATGSGKTLVMAMLIAWSVLNKVTNKHDRRFSDAVLVVCPNLTVKERLSVLLPSDSENYFEKFGLVPRSLLPMLTRGKIMVTNWHLFNPEDDDTTRSVVKRGPESDASFCKRTLGELAQKTNILIINDEAHHAYRPAQREEEPDQDSLIDAVEETEEEFEEATVWINGLDKINSTIGINFCLDMSATPYYIKGSGYEEGVPFPWLVCDFGLVDAIECGIVKIPRVPVDTNSGRPVPEYFELWKWIMEKLPWSDRATTRRRAKPEAVLQQADGAISTLASEWKKTFDIWVRDKHPTPPAMIVVCDNTNLSELVFEKISSGRVLPELKNDENKKEVSVRIDSKLLNEAESRLEESKVDKAARLREVVKTVGKEGMPGANIRTVVSVGMLTEGWDAQNVTQILGLRAFQSQLLCEQVVGRGLRRVNYDDFSVPEYVDVYGIPFEVIPVAKAAPQEKGQTHLGTHVVALPERKEFEIRYPHVEGYIFDVRFKIKADVNSIPPIRIAPVTEPTEIVVKDAVGFKIGKPDRLGPGTEVYQNRDEFYASHRLQTTVYEIASDITDRLRHDARRLLFPQVLQIATEYVDKKVKLPSGSGVRKEEIALQRYRDEIVNRLSEAIRPDTDAGESPILPVIEKYRPTGSTSEVSFRTFKECGGTKKSHVSHVVFDSNWEHSVMFQLEKLEAVKAYVKNDHLNFEIAYEFQGQHHYIPDYIIKLQCNDGSELNVLLEVKGFESEKDRAKRVAAQRWIEAVNHHGGFGKWVLLNCRDPNRITQTLEKLTKVKPSESLITE